MSSTSTSGPGTSTNLIVEIIETLEPYGLDRDEYQLHDSVDVEALEQLLGSSSGDIEVQFPVEGIRLAVTQDRVDVLIDDESRSVDQ